MQDDRFAGRLLRGERIVWTGQPGQGLMLTPQDALLIPFSLLWCGFTIFWELTVLSTGGPSFFLLFGGVFVCVGIYFVAGRFVFDAWLRRNMRYALTDRRVLISRTGPFPSFVTYDLRQLVEVNLSEGSSGRGTIRFGAPMRLDGNSMRGMTPALDPTAQFLGIDEANKVFDLVQRAKDQLAAAAEA